MVQYFIMSDIHSQYDLFTEALKKADFDIDNIDHILLIDGDILDRGSMGDLTIRYLEKLIDKKRLMGTLGNHDVFLIDILNDDYKLEKVKFNIAKNGFIETLQLGFIKDIRNLEITKEFIDEFRCGFKLKFPLFVEWILKLPIYLEFKNHIFVHGFLDFSLENWRDTAKRFAVWDRGYAKEIPDSFDKKLVFGHTPNHYINKQNDIIYDGKKIMIDGGAASRHQINILQLTENEI